MRKILTVLSVMVLILGFGAVAGAATSAANLQVTANVVTPCTVSTSGVNFGNVASEQGGAYATGSITVNCPFETAYQIAFDQGVHYSSGTQLRNVENVDQNMSLWYVLYKDSNHSLQWGDNDHANTYSGGSSLADTGTGSDQTHTVYGELAGFMGGVPGQLSDTVTATVYY